MNVNAFLICSYELNKNIQIDCKSPWVTKGILNDPIVSYNTKLIEDIPRFKGKKLTIFYEKNSDKSEWNLNREISCMLGKKIYGNAIVCLGTIEFGFRIDLTYDDLFAIKEFMTSYRKSKTKKQKELKDSFS